MNNPYALPSLGVSLVIEDLYRSRQFYAGLLGFQRVAVLGPYIWVLATDALRLEIWERGGMGMAAPVTAPEMASESSRLASRVLFRTYALHPLEQRAEAVGATLIAPPHQPCWGGYRMLLGDPDGHVIDVIAEVRYEHDTPDAIN